MRSGLPLTCILQPVHEKTCGRHSKPWHKYAVRNGDRNKGVKGRRASRTASFWPLIFTGTPRCSSAPNTSAVPSSSYRQITGSSKLDVVTWRAKVEWRTCEWAMYVCLHACGSYPDDDFICSTAFYTKFIGLQYMAWKWGDTDSSLLVRRPAFSRT